MNEPTALEYSVLVRELKKLEGKHLSNIYRMGQRRYRMKIGSENIIIEPGKRMNTTKYIGENSTPDTFVQKLKKELKNKRILKINQVNNDRIVEFVFDFGSLIFEMFGKGNVVFIRDGKTVTAVEYRKWSGREITRGKEYTPPGSALEKSPRDLLSTKYVVATLSRTTMGRKYAKEVLFRCGIDEKKQGNLLENSEILCIREKRKEIEENAKAVVFYKNEKPVDFGICSLNEYSEFKAEEKESLNEAVDECYFSEKKEEKSTETEKIEKRLEKQKERLEALKKEEEECRKKGDFIYQKQTEISRLLDGMRNCKPEKIEEKFSVLNAKYNKKEKSVEIETNQ